VIRLKKFAGYALGTLGITILILAVTFCGIVLYPKGVFSNTYQSAIQDKVRYDQSLTGKKLIITGGSNCAYGIDEEALEKATGMQVANLGLYAGFGDLFQTELVKANLGEGDIVLLAYEYNWMDEDAFTDILSDTVMSGIDDDIGLYRYVPARNWNQILGYLFNYAKDKKNHQRNPGEDHHSTIFDTYGRMILDRPYCIMGDFKEGEDYYNPVNLTGVSISEESVQYLKKFKRYVESRGASVYLIAPPLWEEAVACDTAEFQRLKKEEEQKIGIPYLSNPEDYFFPRDDMYDTVYHCNNKGEALRTTLLVQDLKQAGVIEKSGS